MTNRTIHETTIGQVGLLQFEALHKAGMLAAKEVNELILLGENCTVESSGSGTHDPEVKRRAYTAEWNPE